MESTVENDIH